MSRVERMLAEGPKRILALDGGGIRGVLTLEFLLELEKQLREKLQRGEDFVLSDYFDLIAGTSTGAIIATALALGMSVEDVRRFYLECGREIFTKSHFLKWFKHLYPKENGDGEITGGVRGGNDPGKRPAAKPGVDRDA